MVVLRGLAERVQDGVQLGTHSVAEFALQMPHAVPALLEFQISAVLLQLVIDGFRPVRISSIDHAERVAAQLGRLPASARSR